MFERYRDGIFMLRSSRKVQQNDAHAFKLTAQFFSRFNFGHLPPRTSFKFQQIAGSLRHDIICHFGTTQCVYFPVD